MTLGDVAREVGLSKSSVLRYFETREEIYLQITADDWRDWAEAARVKLPPGSLEATAVADVLTDTLAQRPLFCDLLAHTQANLEHNVSPDAVLTLRVAAWGAIGDLSTSIGACLPAISRIRAADIVVVTSILAGAIWLRANPPTAVAAAYRNQPHPSCTHLIFVPSMRQLVRTLIEASAAGGGHEPLLAYPSPPFFGPPGNEPAPRSGG